MTRTEVLEALQKNGAAEPLYGVSYAYLKELKKKIKIDHKLAEQLREKQVVGLIRASERFDPEAFWEGSA